MPKTKFSVFADKEFTGAWRVESQGETPEESTIAIFAGPDCERLANEYAAFKNGVHPVTKPAPALIHIPSAAPLIQVAQPDILPITLVDGRMMNIRPKDLDWTFSVRWRKVCGTLRPALKMFDFVKGND
jgi:hypothetical protein